MRCIATKLCAEVIAEEPRALTNHVVEDEELIGEGQELDVPTTERIHLVVGADELHESRLGQCVRRVRK